ncbi:hypothetical protein KIF59_00155 [Enterobacter cloacae subsp. cloacae]|nr:hypothetical protein [Enterobacter cloacae subsp. cloacae]
MMADPYRADRELQLLRIGMYTVLAAMSVWSDEGRQPNGRQVRRVFSLSRDLQVLIVH